MMYNVVKADYYVDRSGHLCLGPVDYTLAEARAIARQFGGKVVKAGFWNMPR